MTTIHTNGRRAAAPSPDAEIAHLVAEVRQMVDESEALEARISTAKDRLRVLLSERGENWSDDDGYARLMKDSVRTSYDTKALDTLIAKSRRFAFLREHRREFTVRGGVQVK